MATDAFNEHNTLQAFASILDGVEAAHLLKVIHRDLKPENILCSASGSDVVVADFGIAHFSEDDLLTAIETAPDTRLANFMYAAPEQRARGRTVDARADIYALGLILNELFTGEVPHGTDYKSIASVVPQLGYLDSLVSEMLRQASSDRPSSVEAVKSQIRSRGDVFMERQRVEELQRRVVPQSTITDPLMDDPPRLVDANWRDGFLLLKLSQPVTGEWVWALQHMQNYTSIVGKEPHTFSFGGDVARVACRDDQAQQLINHFKSWLHAVTTTYKNKLEEDARQQEAQEQLHIQREIERARRTAEVNRKLVI